MEQAEAEECRERRDAELEFISAAYNPATEAWHNVNATGDPVIHRLLRLKMRKGGDDPHQNDESKSSSSGFSLKIQISLTLPQTYPIGDEPLLVTAQLLDETTSFSTDGTNSSCVDTSKQRKCAWNALPRLVKIAQPVADESVGVEAVFAVLSRVEEWAFQGEWFDFYCQSNCLQDEEDSKSTRQDEHPAPPRSITVTLGRRLIYSHHIIAKVKRADIKSLASEYQLTGYMKIGWPGLLIIEGREDDCISFYDEIRGWNWQYLVVRGEQQELLVVPSAASSKEVETMVAANRKFDHFHEVEDMSVMAQHCREVGLEALFRTAMKVYENVDDSTSTLPGMGSSFATSYSYGALVHVDHMNDPKGYRKWLQKTSKEVDCKLILKQCHEQEDYLKRPTIIVGIVGASSDQVGKFLKRWRTSRVDVDSRGKPCLERQMAILQEGPLSAPGTHVAWEKAMTEDNIHTSDRQLSDLLLQVGGSSWQDAFQSIVLYS